MITNTKKTKKTYYKFFAYMELYGAPRARTIKDEKELFTSALREREREREREYTIIWNYQIILALFPIFFC